MVDQRPAAENGAEDARHRLWPAWSRQLAREVQDIAATFRLPKQHATIEVADIHHAWGVWQPDRQTIVIAAQLIRDYPWSSVVEVLKHEMAHQLADQAGRDGPAHGRAFRSACARLAVADWACQACVAPASLGAPRRPLGDAGDVRRQNRLGKLLALSTSANEHEALAAAVRARRMMDAGGAQVAAGAVDFVQISRGQRRISGVDARLVGLIATHFHVQAVFVHTFDPIGLASFRAVEFLGAAEALAFASHVYHVVWREMLAAWRRFLAARPGRGGQRRAFMLGLLSGLDQQLRTNADAPDRGRGGISGSQALARTAGARSAYARARHPHLVTVGSHTGPLARDAFGAGVDDGSRLRLSRPLEGHAGSRQATLPAARRYFPVPGPARSPPPLE